MKTVYVDESGSPSPTDGDRYLVITALIAKSDRAIRLQIKRARRRMRVRSSMNELKASRNRPIIIKRLLRTLATSPNEFVTIIVNKENTPVDQAEIVYQNAIGYAVQYCVRKYPQVHIYLDKRYINRRQATALENPIRQQISNVPDQVVLIDQVDSTAYTGLQAVDFVAWAFREKYEHGETWAVEIISDLVIVEEVVRGSKIAALPGGR